MIRLAQKSRECQEERLEIKTLSQQMQNIAVHGTGLSPWEAAVLVETIEQVYFAEQAREQGGLLSQEDLAEILMCDVRTILRSSRVAYLRRKSFDDYQSALTIGISVAATRLDP